MITVKYACDMCGKVEGEVEYEMDNVGVIDTQTAYLCELEGQFLCQKCDSKKEAKDQALWVHG